MKMCPGNRDECRFNPHGFQKRGIENREVAALPAFVLQGLPRELDKSATWLLAVTGGNRILRIGQPEDLEGLEESHSREQIGIDCALDFPFTMLFTFLENAEHSGIPDGHEGCRSPVVRPTGGIPVQDGMLCTRF